MQNRAGKEKLMKPDVSKMRVGWRAPCIAAALALGLAGCGGGGDEDSRDDAPRYGKLVVFGDSLSDVGTYKVSAIAQLGGGQFTVNGSGARNWTERLAQRIGVALPCAAQTGLESALPQIPAAPVTNHPGCWSYAQGGARVTHPYGPYNAGLGGDKGLVGALTQPVNEQTERHLALGGGFGESDLVAVWAGANDLFVQLEMITAAQTDAPGAIAAMSTAGTELAGYVKDRVLAKGARRVLVLTLPDVSLTPLGRNLGETAEERQQIQGLMQQMARAFNDALLAGLPAQDARLLKVDIFTSSQAQAQDPAKYGISNITDPACNLAIMALPTSLVCTDATVIAGDTSKYFYADDVHPAPYGHQLISDFVQQQMQQNGWL